VAIIPMASNNLLPIQLKVIGITYCFANMKEGISKLWHDRYDHLNYRGLKLLSTKQMVIVLPQIDQVHDVCEA